MWESRSPPTLSPGLLKKKPGAFFSSGAQSRLRRPCAAAPRRVCRAPRGASGEALAILAGGPGGEEPSGSFFCVRRVRLLGERLRGGSQSRLRRPCAAASRRVCRAPRGASARPWRSWLVARGLKNLRALFFVSGAQSRPGPGCCLASGPRPFPMSMSADLVVRLAGGGAVGQRPASERRFHPRNRIGGGAQRQQVIAKR